MSSEEKIPTAATKSEKKEEEKVISEKKEQEAAKAGAMPSQKKEEESAQKEDIQSSSSTPSSATPSGVISLPDKQAVPHLPPPPEGLTRRPGSDLPDLMYAVKPGQKVLQTFPPTVPLSEMYPKKRYPLGKLEKHLDEGTTHRSANSEKIRLEIMNEGITNDFRRAAEAHRQMRAYARQLLRPGMRLIDFVTEVEMRGRYLMEDSFLSDVSSNLLRASCSSLNPAMSALLGKLLNDEASSSATPSEDAAKGKKGKGKGKGKAALHEDEETRQLISSLYPDYTHSTCGLSFPTGLSLNNCAAHYTPNPGDTRVLLDTDVMKIDIGTHMNGHIIDSAFTVCLDPTMQPLIEASKEGTWTGIKMAGIDARFIEIGDAIEEVICSYEVEENKRMRSIRPVENLSGHSLGDYIVHAGKLVPIHKNACDAHLKMEEGEAYAIETFATTGKGTVSDGPDCSHYMMAPDAMSRIGSVRNPKARKLLNHINQRFKTLAWCRRWLEETGEKQHAIPLKALIDADLVHPYAPLSDISRSHVSQHEHTILIKPTGKEIVSFGNDD
ncbi:putative Methionine aminopeptidase 2 [Monocercomonoides exilis]|uniref:putative Methionine aminopeptidase 2 n=1 Tax=Monocercomonoides exilis TaxID=2049356 RepID=UPI003559BA2C|nr:putative Methionine aminopeptidase 2 [Monocercomonoides exilis]